MTGDPNGFSTQGSRRPQISETSVPGTGGSWANFFRTKKRITPRWARDLTRALGGPAATSAAAARPRHPSTGSERRVQGQGADESLRKARKLAPDETSRKNSPEPSLLPSKPQEVSLRKPIRNRARASNAPLGRPEAAHLCGPRGAASRDLRGRE